MIIRRIQKEDWTLLQSKNIIHRPHLDAYCEQVSLPNGKVFDEFYHLHFEPVVCVVAETEAGQLIMEVNTAMLSMRYSPRFRPASWKRVKIL